MTPNRNDLTRNLRKLTPGRTAAQAAALTASRTLATAAAARGLIDIATWTTDSPVGELFLAVTSRGVLHVGFADEPREDALVTLAREVSPRILEAAAPTDEIRRELDQYFAGDRTRFEVNVDRRLVHGIAREVLAATRRIPFGGTTTYGDLAAKIGRPRAARAVGNALGANPIPIVIPCHRVLRAGGGLGGYGGGIGRKQRLLALEGVAVRPDLPRRT
jgi:methylated-DNA-[protein]-cysteine S-methyltransferase